MVQKVVELTDEQAEMLEERSRLLGVPEEGLLTDAVERLLRSPITQIPPIAGLEEREPESDDERRRRAARMPSFHSDVTDLSENHDKYLAEAFESCLSS